MSNPSAVQRKETTKAKTPAGPAKASPVTPSVAAAVSSPKPKDAPKGPPKNAKGKSQGKPGKPMSVEETAKTPCIFHQNPCVHGGTCQYSHVKALPAKPKNSKADSRAKPKPAAPKVAAAVAITAALSYGHSVSGHWVS